MSGLIAALLLSLPASAQAGRIYVDWQAPDLNRDSDPDGRSWKTAWGRLTTALLHARAGDEIWVADGIYRPYTEPEYRQPDHKERGFLVPAGVRLYGGFTGLERSVEERNWRAAPSILDGDTGYEEWGGEFARHVVTLHHNSRLDGFTVRNGRALMPESDRERLLRDHAGETADRRPFGSFSGSPGDSNSPASGNPAHDYHGGGVLIVEGSPVLVRLIIENNQADQGGGLYIGSGDPLISDVLFRNNYARSGGGAVLIEGRTGAKLDNVRFYANESARDGGAVLALGPGAKAAFNNALFSENRAETRGGALAALNGNRISITQATFWGNQALNDGGALYNGAYGPDMAATETALEKVIFQANQSRYGKAEIGDWNDARSVISHGALSVPYPGRHIRHVDPGLVAPVAGDFRLSPSTPVRGYGFKASGKEDLQ